MAEARRFLSTTCCARWAIDNGSYPPRGPLAVRLMQDMRWAVKERHGLTSVEPLHAAELRFLPASPPTFEQMIGVPLDPAYRATDELASGHPHRATRSRTRRPKSSEVALQLHQTAYIRGPWPLRYSTRRQNSRLKLLNRSSSRIRLDCLA